jgi:hypothetical protein
MNFSVENDSAELFTGKVLAICDQFISNWNKSKGFGMIKDRVIYANIEKNIHSTPTPTKQFIPRKYHAYSM